MSVLAELRFALRTLLRRPALPALAMITLIAGITGATVLFSAVDAWVIHAVPFHDPDAIAWITTTEESLSAAEYEDLRREQKTFSATAAYSYQMLTLHSGESPERLAALAVERSFFDILQVKPTIGRIFLPEEMTPGKEKVVLISHGFWQARFQENPAVLGSSLELNGEPHSIIGVLPAKFHYSLSGGANLWLPYAPTAEVLQRREIRGVKAIGRVRTSYQAANQDLAGFTQRLAKAFPESNRNVRVYTEPLSEEVARATGREILLVSLAIAIGLMLIACSNVANLFLSRALDRQRQTAIQLSLGAGRGRLIGQSLLETLLVFGGSSLLSVLTASWVGGWISSLIPLENRSFLPNYGAIPINADAFATTVVVSLLAGALFGLGPALQGLGMDVARTLKESGSAISGNRARSRMQMTFVVGQVLLATVLLAATAQLIDGFRAVTQLDPGFGPDNLLVFRVSLDARRYDTATERRHFWERALERLPKTTGAAAYLPFIEDSRYVQFQAEAHRDKGPRSQRNGRYNAVDTSFLSTLGVPLVRGRLFTAQDRDTAPRVAVVNESLARREFPDRNPIGERLLLRGQATEIVGIVGDIRYSAFVPPTESQIYVPLAQDPPATATFALRQEGDPMAAAPGVRRLFAELDPQQAVWGIRTMRESMYRETVGFQIATALLLSIGGLALLLAAIGLYAVVSFSVVRRTREFGIRTALGATAGDVIGMVSRQSLRIAAYGFVPGVILSLALGRWLQSIVPEAKAQSPVTVLGLITVLLGVMFLASFLPALRAGRTDPLRALRHE